MIRGGVEVTPCTVSSLFPSTFITWATIIFFYSTAFTSQRVLWDGNLSKKGIFAIHWKF